MTDKTTAKLTNIGLIVLSDFYQDAGNPTQEEIEKRGRISRATTRKIMSKESVQVLSIFRLLTTISVIGDKECPSFLPNLHYKTKF